MHHARLTSVAAPTAFASIATLATTLTPIAATATFTTCTTTPHLPLGHLRRFGCRLLRQ